MSDNLVDRMNQFYADTNILPPGHGNQGEMSAMEVALAAWDYWKKTQITLNTIQKEISSLRNEIKQLTPKGRNPYKPAKPYTAEGQSDNEVYFEKDGK